MQVAQSRCQAACSPRAFVGGRAAACRGIRLVSWMGPKRDRARPLLARARPKLERRPREREGDAAARLRFSMASSLDGQEKEFPAGRLV